MLLALPFTALAQSTAPESFKGANKIEIFTGLTFEENYTLVGRTLIEKDYELDVRDKEFGLITTKHKGFKFMLGANEGVYYLKFVVQNEKIVDRRVFTRNCRIYANRSSNLPARI